MVKRKHQLLTESERDQILAIPTDRDHLARLYSFEPSDIDIIGARRERRNRLGVALQLALLRHPGTTLAQIIRDKGAGSVANMGHGRAASPSWGIRQHWRNAY